MTSQTSIERATGNGRLQGSVIDIAAALAEEFRQGAAEYDRTGDFPSANYERMRTEGYLRALVPAELGGLGAGILEMSHAQQALARGCASTALAVNMHQFQVGFMADGWRKTRAPAAEKALRAWLRRASFLPRQAPRQSCPAIGQRRQPPFGKAMATALAAASTSAHRPPA